MTHKERCELAAWRIKSWLVKSGYGDEDAIGGADETVVGQLQKIILETIPDETTQEAGR